MTQSQPARPAEQHPLLTSADALHGRGGDQAAGTARFTPVSGDDAHMSANGDVSMTRLRGCLPPPPPRFADTPITQRVRLCVETAVSTNRIATISGPVGTGKSTAVADAARHLNAPVAYVTMDDTPSVRASLQIIWESITRTPAFGTEKQIKDNILRYLLMHDLTLLIDDAHHVTVRGLRVLTSIWNALDATRGRGVTIVFIGNGLNAAFTRVPEIQSRVVSRYEVPLLGGVALYKALAHIEPRTTATDMEVLQQLDRQHFGGELRQWVQFLEVARKQHPTAAPDEPFTAKEVRQALIRQGWV